MIIERKDPYLGFRFRVEIDGLIVGGFSEISGLEAVTEVEDVKVGGLNDYIYRLPKETKYPNLVLKRGLTDSDCLWTWHQNVIMGKVERKTIHIILLDSTWKDTWWWSFKEAFPIKWSGGEFKSDSNSVTFETLEIAHHGFEKT